MISDDMCAVTPAHSLSFAGHENIMSGRICRCFWLGC